jgi:hypothetical protein
LGRPLPHGRGSGLLLFVVAAALVSACAHGATPPPRTPGATPTATAAATPATAVPDTEQVEVLTTGVGDYDLQAIPVALIRNAAVSHSALSVVAHFSVHQPSGTYALDASPVSLAPAQTLAVAALCTDACRGATGVDVSVSVGSWGPATASSFAAVPGAWACGSPCAGSGGFQGSAKGTLHGTAQSGAQVDLFASCTTGGGAIVGGGLTLRIWPGPGATVPVSVPVLVRHQPSACTIYAAEP